MKSIILKKLRLENFKAMSFEMDFNEEGKTIIRGENKTGKSHVLDAYCWLLTGVDQEGRFNYDLYDSNLEMTADNAIPAIVTGTFLIDGREVELQRFAQQKWTRKRNSSEYTKDKSDTYKFFVDGLEVTANDYKVRISEMFCPLDKLRFITNIRSAHDMDWKELRRHFSDMVGEIKDEDLHGDYTAIESLLAKYGNTDNVKEKLNQELKPLKKEVDELDADKKAQTKLLPDISPCEESRQKILEAEARIKEIDDEIIGFGEKNRPLKNKRETELLAIDEKKMELKAKRKAFDEEQDNAVRELKQKYMEAKSKADNVKFQNNAIKDDIAAIDRDIAAVQNDLKSVEDRYNALRTENATIKAREFNDNQTCSTCGQVLPHDMIDDLRIKFYEQKEKDHKACVEKGKQAAAQKEERTQRLKELEEKKASIKVQEVPSFEEEKKAYEDAKEGKRMFDDTEEFKTLTEEISRMEESLTVVPESDTSELQAEKDALLQTIKDLSVIVAREEEYARGQKRIEEIEEKKRQVGIEMAHLEGLLDTAIRREREWADIVRTRANKYFKYCHIEMTEISKAGEINDICTVTVGGVDFKTTNTASSVLAGVDIANAFMACYDVAMPTVMDNAEQITDNNLPTVSGQLVAMYVDKDYPVLTKVN
jgi:DNA repair exonuclease SbcCD ATPase subunit